MLFVSADDVWEKRATNQKKVCTNAFLKVPVFILTKLMQNIFFQISVFHRFIVGSGSKRI